MRKPKTKIVCVAFVTLVAGVITAIACGWSSFDDHSVRFNYERTGRGFYRLPPLPIVVDPSTGKELSTRQLEQFDYGLNESDTADGAPEKDNPDQPTAPEEVWTLANSAVEKDELSDAGTLLRKYLDMTSLPTPGYGVGSSQDFYEYRNSAYDMLDALSALQQGSSRKSVKAFLEARGEVTNSVLTEEEFDEVLKKAIPDSNLSDNWAYLLCAQLAKSKDQIGALKAFQKHAVDFPASEKQEAVLFMIARLTMRQSYSSTAKGCYIEKPTDVEESNYRQTDRVAIEPKEKCQDESWHTAIKAFRQLIKKYPHGRYVNDARGWIANLYLNGEETAPALAEYYRLLGSTDLAVRLQAKKSLQILGHEYDDDTLDKVEALIADEPDAALAYAYHRIYNHAIDFTYVEFEDWCCSGKDRWSEIEKERERVKKENDKGRHELERIAKFATAMVKRHGRPRVSADFLLRVAQAQLELQNFKDALSLADQTLRVGVTKDSRAQALWVKGSSEHRQKKLAKARTTFSQLIKEFPDHKLTEGARRLLAITAEDQDDLETALDLYFALEYEQDVAYFVDVLMPIDRLAKYVAQRTESEHHNTLLYSLGLRYMREKRWNEARATLVRLSTEKGRDDYLENERDKTWFFPKEVGYAYGEPRITYIKTSWVVQDLKTIDIIEYHEKAVEEAVGDEAKAEAMYQLASAYFEADDLTFYNPAMWDGSRGGSLSGLLFSRHERLPNESRVIFEHLEEHDPWARAIPIYIEVADRFPQTKAARDALYSAAVAHQRLAERNGPWGVFYTRGLFAGPRNLTYADVRNIYPRYQLPRGTYGWEPSTRTVNGGPGWAAPPKPLPRLTRTERAWRKLGGWYDAYSPGVGENVRLVSQTFIYYLTAYLYTILIGLIGTAVWANRSAIYHGPIRNGYDVGIVAGRYVHRFWSRRIANALPRLSFLYLVKRAGEYFKAQIKKT
jgi:TolA-binding protein